MFGEKLKELREKENLSQAELSQKLNIAQNTLSQYELNKREPNFETLIKIADHFKVTIDYLLR